MTTERTVTERKRDGAAMKRLTINMPLQLAKELAHRAIDEQRDMSAIVADAITTYLARPPKK
jgi:metal-responsive CopG/Arc/MetJ family transcriptional regulator